MPSSAHFQQLFACSLETHNSCAVKYSNLIPPQTNFTLTLTTLLRGTVTIYKRISLEQKEMEHSAFQHHSLSLTHTFLLRNKSLSLKSAKPGCCEQACRVTSLIIPPSSQPIGEVSHPDVNSHLAGRPTGKCHSPGKGLTFIVDAYRAATPLFPLPTPACTGTHTHTHTEHSTGKTTTHSKTPFLSIRLLAVIHLRISCCRWRFIFLFSNLRGRKKLPLPSH